MKTPYHQSSRPCAHRSLTTHWVCTASVAVLFASAASLIAAERSWIGDTAVDASFATPGNWTGGVVPGSDDKPIIGSGSSRESPVVFQSENWTVKGYTVDGGGGFKIAGGDLDATAESRIGNTGAGSLSITGGVLRNAQVFSVGYGSSSTGDFLLDGGCVTNDNTTYIGNSGNGCMVMSNGVFCTTNTKGTLYIGNATESVGALSLSGGEVALGYQLIVGNNGTGTFTMDGGSIYTYRHGIVGNAANGTGYVHLVSGTEYKNSYDLIVGNAGHGHLVLENTFPDVQCRSLQIGVESGSHGVVETYGGRFSTGATITTYIGKGGHGELHMRGTDVYGPGKGSVVVRDTEDAYGLVRGWGSFSTVGGASTRRLNGVVVADGYGEEHDLDFGTSSRPYPCESNIENTSTNGYYAVNKGRMVIPAYVLQPGTNSVAWCEAQDDTEIDMVNSAAFVLDIKAPKKNMKLSGALYAPDRSDVPALSPTRVPLGIWKFVFTETLRSAGVTVRYDEAAAKGKVPTLWRYDESTSPARWVDTEANVLSGSRLQADVPALGFFAVTVPAGKATILFIQ